MVLERISSEPELHELYLKLINYLNSDLFDEIVVSVTIDTIKVSSIRQQLQNNSPGVCLILQIQKRKFDRLLFCQNFSFFFTFIFPSHKKIILKPLVLLFSVLWCCFFYIMHLLLYYKLLGHVEEKIEVRDICVTKFR